MDELHGDNKPLLITILVLCIINFLGISCLVGQKAYSSINIPFNSNSSRDEASLPIKLNSEEGRAVLLNQFIRLYNARDGKGMYDRLTPTAQAQISLSKISATTNKLHDIFGGIKNGKYDHVDVNNTVDGKIYVLFYKVECEKFNGILKISVVGEGDKLCGFYLSTDQI